MKLDAGTLLAGDDWSPFYGATLGEDEPAYKLLELVDEMGRFSTGFSRGSTLLLTRSTSTPGNKSIPHFVLAGMTPF